MDKLIKTSVWLQIALGLVLSLVGIFQLGVLIGAAAVSGGSSLQDITLIQFGLISSGLYGIHLLIYNYKKLKLQQH